MSHQTFLAVVDPSEGQTFKRPLWYNTINQKLFGWDYSNVMYALLCQGGSGSPTAQPTYWGTTFYDAQGSTVWAYRTFMQGAALHVMQVNMDSTVNQSIYYKDTGEQLASRNWGTIEFVHDAITDDAFVYLCAESGNEFGVVRLDSAEPTWTVCPSVAAHRCLYLEHGATNNLIVSVRANNTDASAIASLAKTDGSLQWIRDLNVATQFIYAVPNASGILVCAGLKAPDSHRLLLMQLDALATTVLWQKQGPINTNGGNDEGFCQASPDQQHVYFSFRDNEQVLVVGKVNVATGDFVYLNQVSIVAAGAWATWGTLQKTRVKVTDIGELYFVCEGVDYAQYQQAYLVKLDPTGALDLALELKDPTAWFSFIHSVSFDDTYAYVSGYTASEMPDLETQFLIQIALDGSSLGYYRPAVYLDLATNLVVTPYTGVFSASAFATVASAKTFMSGTFPTPGLVQVYPRIIKHAPTPP